VSSNGRLRLCRQRAGRQQDESAQGLEHGALC
jgi:hypothetical protein